MNKKIVYILLDGASDGISYEITSLEKANMPYLTKIAMESKGGMVYPIEKGVAPESDTAAISLLGYNPRKYRIARGILEALGSSVVWEEGDLALRCNFATAKGNMILDRRVGRSLSDYEAKILEKEIMEKVKLPENYNFTFKHTIGHRAVLVIYRKDEPLGDNITNLDPGYVLKEGIAHAVTTIEKEIKECEALDEHSKKSAQLVNEFFKQSRLILEKSEVNKIRSSKGLLEANIVLTRDAGSKLPKFSNFYQRFGLKGLCIADMPVELGIAKVLGMNVISSKDHSDVKEMYVKKVKILKENLDKFDFFFVHIKGADEYAHDGDFEGKVSALEDIDSYFFKRFYDDINLDEITIIVSSDHCTPPKLKSHSDEAVPFIIRSKNVKGDGLSKFSEKECSKGSLGLIEHGYELLERIFTLIT
ncbi:MAG: alkaline phosphatase family protein [Thermoproteota archaeon]|jgi:2,3-bisphosphoglycerate-independent phosphoglycerate mutase, archaeal form